VTDRQAAEAVRARIDWKYVLGLSLTDPGFHYSILSEFRGRLLEGGQEADLLDKVLERLIQVGLLKAGGQQRTDSTHVLASVRDLNRLECVGETLRQTLEDLALVAPDWLLAQITSDWFDRYSARVESYRLPKKKSEREVLLLQIGQDGSALLSAIYRQDAPEWLRELPSVAIMIRVWIQQYYMEEGEFRWRDKNNLPPAKQLIISPYDVESRNRTKRTTNWSGYAVHLTETCDAADPNLITHVETTPATTADVEVTDRIHRALADRGLLPTEHLVDTAYTSAEHLVEAQRDYRLDLVGPVAGGASWQAKAGQGFDVACFAVDWVNQTATCPQGKTSIGWHVRQEAYGHDYIEIRFNPTDCRACTRRSDCTRAKRHPRILSIKPQAEYEALRLARKRQKTDEFKQKYKRRAGVEGTISQGTRSFDLRRTRYIGLAKTHLQHLATAAAMNLTRVAHWFMGINVPKAQTRRS
jgi:transposase